MPGIVTPEISVIIVNWNGRHFLDDCLGAMRGQTFRSFETILVDNGSSDGSAEYVRNYFPDVKLVELKENLGFTGGNIAGYEIATGDLIVLLNNDTEAREDWLERIHDAGLQFPKAGSFASKMIYFDDRNRIENCGFDIGVSGTTIDLGRDEQDSPNCCVTREVFGACGGAAAYRRSMLDEIGFLDPDFFMIYEDVDLSFRAQLHGYPCVYVPNAVVFHRYRSSLRAVPTRQVFYSQRNIEFVYLKNMPKGLILRSVAQRFLYELGSAVYFCKRGQWSAFFKSKFSVMKGFAKLMYKRRKVQSKKIVANAHIRALMRPAMASKWVKFRRSWRQSFQS